MDDRLGRQLAFAVAIDGLKSVARRTVLVDRSRQESVAEHSWHLGMLALLLAEEAAEPVDVTRVVELVLVHDLVELEAGDTFCYDPAAVAGQEEREREAARRLFATLPEDQAAWLHERREEFEAGATAEACFAAALDRIQPVLNNFHTGGHSWVRHGVRREQVLARLAPAATIAPRLHAHVTGLVEEAVRRGWIAG